MKGLQSGTIQSAPIYDLLTLPIYADTSRHRRGRLVLTLIVAITAVTANSNADSIMTSRDRFAADLHTILAQLNETDAQDATPEASPPVPEYELTEQIVRSGNPNRKEIEFRIKFKNCSDEFLLGRLLRDTHNSSETVLGFDTSSLRLNWVDPKNLLMVRWHTIYQGRIGAAVQSTMLLRRTSSTWETLVIDNATSPTAGPRYNPGTGDCTFEFMLLRESNHLYFTETASDWSRSASRPDRWISIWPCELTKPIQFRRGLLIFVPGENTNLADTLKIIEAVRINSPDKEHESENENWLTENFPRVAFENEYVRWIVAKAPIHAYLPDETIYYHLVETAELPMSSTDKPPLVVGPNSIKTEQVVEPPMSSNTNCQ